MVSVRPGMAHKPLLIAGGLVLLVLIGAWAVSTAAPPPDPAVVAARDFTALLQQARSDITTFQFDQAEDRLYELRHRLGSPLLEERRGDYQASIEEAETALAHARLDRRVHHAAQELWTRLRELVSEPDLDGLQADIAAFRADPLGVSRVSPLPGYDPGEHTERFAEAVAALNQERERRRIGLVEPDWPDADGAGLDARRARVEYHHAEGIVASNIAEQNYRQAFERVRAGQAQFDNLSFQPLWQQTADALEAAWPAILAEAQQQVAQARTATSDRKAGIRRQLRDRIARLGDERYMAELRELLRELL